MHKKLVLKRLWGVIEIISQIPPESFKYLDEKRCVLPHCKGHMNWQIDRGIIKQDGKKLYFSTLLNQLVDYHGLRHSYISTLFWGYLMWPKLTQKGVEHKTLILNMWKPYVKVHSLGTSYSTGPKKGLDSSLQEVQNFFEFLYYLIENDFIIWEQPD